MIDSERNQQGYLSTDSYGEAACQADVELRTSCTRLTAVLMKVATERTSRCCMKPLMVVTPMKIIGICTLKSCRAAHSNTKCNSSPTPCWHREQNQRSLGTPRCAPTSDGKPWQPVRKRKKRLTAL